MLTPDVFLGFFFMCTWRKGKLRFKSQHSLLFHTALSSSLGSGQDGEEHVSDFGVTVGFSCNVEVKMMGRYCGVVNQELWGVGSYTDAILKYWARRCLFSRPGCLYPLEFFTCLHEHSSLPAVRTELKLSSCAVPQLWIRETKAVLTSGLAEPGAAWLRPLQVLETKGVVLSGQTDVHLETRSIAWYEGSYLPNLRFLFSEATAPQHC